MSSDVAFGFRPIRRGPDGRDAPAPNIRLRAFPITVYLRAAWGSVAPGASAAVLPGEAKPAVPCGTRACYLVEPRGVEPLTS